MVQVVGRAVVARVVETLAVRAWSDEIAGWLRRTVPGYLRRQPSVLVDVPAPRLAALLDAEGLAPDVRTRIESWKAAGGRVLVPGGRGLAAFEAEAGDMVDWLTSLPAADRHLRRIGRMSLADALAMSRRWHERLLRDADAQAASSDGTRTAEVYDDGVRVVELASSAALRHEGGAMGHCVGGYWDRVRDGSCRIFSIRDADGRSHVTIEVARPETVEIEGRGGVPLARRPRGGVDVVPVALADAVVRQVRGRGNAVPVERWALRVREFLSDRGWHDEILPSTETVVVHTVGGRHFGNPSDALAEAGRILVRGVSIGSTVAKAVPAGTGAILGVADEAARAAFERRIVSAAGRRDAGVAVRSVVASSGRTAVHAVRHAVPVGSIEVVATGIGGGEDQRIFERVRNALSDILDAVERDAGSVHVLPLPAGCGVTPGMLNSMFLACGLAARRETVLRRNADGLREAVRAMRDEARKAVEIRRRSGTSADPADNYLANLLRDDAPTRLRAMAAASVHGAVVLGEPDGSASVRSAVPSAATVPAKGSAARRMTELVAGPRR